MPDFWRNPLITPLPIFTTAIASAASLIADIEYAYCDGKELPGQALNESDNGLAGPLRFGMTLTLFLRVSAMFSLA